MTILLLCAALLPLQAQHVLKAAIRNHENHPLPGATLSGKEDLPPVAADSTGTAVLRNLPTGKQTFRVTHAGYREALVSVFLTSDTTLLFTLEPAEAEGDEEAVVVSATRTSRSIGHTPTRIEVISGEELAEKGNMKPGEIRMLLSESTGIQIQQTSATSYNAGIRIQGLEGRYTQVLRDGYPLYAGFAGGLSIMQIAPLDLRQVEVIKGSSSTLYGGGAIAGLVNLVSKTPGPEREASFLANGTSAGGLDLSGFYSERYGKAGLTLFASRNSGAPYDPAGIGLTALPQFRRYTLNPRLFLYGHKTTADVGVSYITERRLGGSIDYIKRGGSGYYERNNTDRLTTQLGIVHRLDERTTLQLKNSYTRFDRSLELPSYRFRALQQSSFSELTWNHRGEQAQWVAGANLLTDDLSEGKPAAIPPRDYHYNTFGLFVQNSWSPNERITLETGLRGDRTAAYGWELLPRLSALFRVSPQWTTRLGGGWGYKTPTIFTEEAERLQFLDVLPIDEHYTQNERSVGGNWDVHYRTHLGAISLSLNHLFFYTRLRNPLVLQETPDGKRIFRNAGGPIDTKGMETNLRLLYGDFKLFVGYTFTDANTHYSGEKSWLPLTARHRLNKVLMYEIEEKLKLGLEGYYFSRQQLGDGSSGKPYWITGFMAEKLWEHFSLFVNFENFTDTRQTRFDSIFTGPVDQPLFRDIYAPVEGFVVNGGIKIRL
ncbi:TonB-dependent receptor [Paraflavisolibacter sp. H34]|uniref:TonB-dependent receptor n=1 Tax=Huijunlia imazamoxiresistens TaxID=3127457 RepID=UPI00301B2A66